MSKRNPTAGPKTKAGASLLPAPVSVATETERPADSQQRLAAPYLDYCLNALAALSFCIAVCCNAWYVFVTFRVLFHSDAAMKVLLAEEMARTRSLFPPTWYYVNDIPIVFPHFFVLFFRLIFSNYLLQHAAAVFTGVLLFSATIFLLGRELGLRPAHALVLQAMLLSGFSEYFAHALFGEASYLMLSTATLFVAYLVIKICSPKVEPAWVRVVRWVGLAGLVALTVAGGSRAALTISAPALIAATLFLLIETRFLSARDGTLPRSVLIVAAAICLGTAIGFAANRALVHHCRISYATFAAFAPFERIGQNFSVLFQGWLIGGGALANAGRVTDVLPAIRVVVRFCANLILTFLPWVLFLHYARLTSKALRFTLLLFAVTCSATLYFYLFGTVAVDWTAFRYFTAPFVLCLIVAIGFFEEMSRRYGTGFTMLTVPVCVVLAGFGCAALVHPVFAATGLPAVALPSSASENPKQPIVEAARKEGLTFGYASYWNAAVITVLSSAKIRVLPVHVLPMVGITPMRYLGSEWWYHPEAHHGPVFVFVTDSEMQSVPFLYDLVGTPQRVIPVGGGSLLIYPRNIAEGVAAWNPQREINAPLPVNDRRVLIQTPNPEITTASDGRGVIPVTITNLGKSVMAWGGTYPVLVGAHLKSEAGSLVNFDFAVTPLPVELQPGASCSARIHFQLPSPGRYVVDVDVVQGGVAWFAPQESKVLPVQVVYPGAKAASP